MKTIIHVNQHVIRRNAVRGEQEPVLAVKTYKSSTYAHEAVIKDDLGAVEDDIIAIALRIVVETQYKLNSHSMPVLPNRVGAGIIL